MRWVWTIDGPGGPRDVLVEADPDVSIGSLAAALDLDVPSIAPDADAETSVREAAIHNVPGRPTL